jgi:hypothetical protein
MHDSVSLSDQHAILQGLNQEKVTQGKANVNAQSTALPHVQKVTWQSDTS